MNQIMFPAHGGDLPPFSVAERLLHRITNDIVGNHMKRKIDAPALARDEDTGENVGCFDRYS